MTHSGNATLAPYKLLLFPFLFTANTDLGIGVTSPAHPRSLFDPTFCFFVQCLYPEPFKNQIACHVISRKLCINIYSLSFEDYSSDFLFFIFYFLKILVNEKDIIIFEIVHVVL
jgi:hypothetical protein